MLHLEGRFPEYMHTSIYMLMMCLPEITACNAVFYVGLAAIMLNVF